MSHQSPKYSAGENTETASTTLLAVNWGVMFTGAWWLALHLVNCTSKCMILLWYTNVLKTPSWQTIINPSVSEFNPLELPERNGAKPWWWICLKNTLWHGLSTCFWRRKLNSTVRIWIYSLLEFSTVWEWFTFLVIPKELLNLSVVCFAAQKRNSLTHKEVRNQNFRKHPAMLLTQQTMASLITGDL